MSGTGKDSITPDRAPAADAGDGIPSATAAPEPDFTPEIDAPEIDAPEIDAGAEPENAILREARRVRDLAAAKARTATRDINWKTAAGIGIGSAALLAAVLYAGRDRK